MIPPSSPAADPAGLLVVSIDRLPAWILPPWGATWVSTPCLDALAGGGIVFDRAVIRRDDPAITLADLRSAGLAAALEARGWRPVVVTDDAAAAAWPGAELRVVESRGAARLAGDPAATDLARLTAAATAAVAGGARCVWCHAASLGRVWDAPVAFRDRYVDPDDPPPTGGVAVPDMVVDAGTDPDLVMGVRQRFAGQVTLLDECLAGLVAAVSAESAAGTPWTICVVGIRGLPLGLHGHIGTSAPLLPYGELMHVPAVIVDAAGRMAGQRYGGLVTPADLGATLAGLLGSATTVRPAEAEPWEGRSLAGLFATWSAEPRDRVVMRTPAGCGLVTPAWTAVGAPPRIRLHAKPDDFFEVCDVADRCGAVVEAVTDVLEAAAAGDEARAWGLPLRAEATHGG